MGSPNARLPLKKKNRRSNFKIDLCSKPVSKRPSLSYMKCSIRNRWAFWWRPVLRHIIWFLHRSCIRIALDLSTKANSNLELQSVRLNFVLFYSISKWTKKTDLKAKVMRSSHAIKLNIRKCKNIQLDLISSIDPWRTSPKFYSN